MLNADWGFLFDPVTVTMCCVVTFVSSIVHLYSTEYMAYDPHLPRLMSYLPLFISSNTSFSLGFLAALLSDVVK